MTRTILDHSSRCQAVNDVVDQILAPRCTIGMDAPSKHSFNQTAGRRLKLARKHHKLTQQKCADMCKVDISTWSKWETGNNPIDPELLEPFIRMSVATLDWIFYERNARIGPDLIRETNPHFKK